MFGFFGITDVRVVRAECLAMGEAAKAAALVAATTDITTQAQAVNETGAAQPASGM